MLPKKYASLLALLCLVALPAQSQHIDLVSGQARTSVHVQKLDQKPVVDGHLDEPVWEQASAIQGLLQVEPRTGEPGSEKTDILLFHNGHTLFIGIRAFDREPGKIIARQRKRDATLDGDDGVVIALDSIGDRRSGYLFQINPLGARTDAVIINGQDVNYDWNGIWTAKTAITETGWTAEIAIPFASISFMNTGVPWGINVERTISRKNEVQRWSAVSRDARVQYVGSMGQALGLEELRAGLGIDVIPYAKSTWQHTSNRNNRSSSLTGDVGLDFFYKFLPTASVALTVNTDFSSTEVDDRVINLTRFPTFFPEKREFFLRDCEVFDFGGITKTPLPYFSRRIGIDGSGHAVDILAGIKSTGRIGKVSYGLIDVEMDDPTNGGSRNLGVARGRVDLLDESSAGFIFTRGSPAGDPNAWLGGVDLNYRTSRWRKNGYLQLCGYAMRMHESDKSDAGAYGVNLLTSSDRIAWDGTLLRVDEGFAPPLGFTRQKGIYQASGKMRLRWRPEYVDRIDWGTYVDYVTDLDGKLDYFEASLVDFTITNHPRDSYGASWFIFRERIQKDFTVGKDTIIHTGTYDTNRVSTWYRTTAARPTRLSTTISYGGFYDGTSTTANVTLANRSWARLHVTANYEETIARLRGETIHMRVAGLKTDILFTPDLALMLAAQWDNISDDFGLNLRLRWTITPGRDIYVVLNQRALTDTGWNPTSTDMTAKINWTFRF